jgi:hypothetical protein
MVSDVLLYVGSAAITIWGIAHIIPTKSVVKGFGAISTDNQRIITQEWIAEGLALCFIGLLVLSITITAPSDDPVAVTVYRACAGMLVAMAVLTSLTGARTSVLPIKICPFVKTTVAILFLVASMI